MTIRERTPEDNPALLDIWHRAVEATHTFLTEHDIAELYPQVRDLYRASRYGSPKPTTAASPASSA
ncbi:hypothetical protein [Burkholderia ubonensis]|uniref:hypothetical protein n=1 Tax=Burkholderia ubonensis TaxID=101571 RepID=UPI000A88A81D|nr:hypothetical protein [Burkholderia ubonensis]